MLFILADYLLDLIDVFVSPATLMMTQTPERRKMCPADITVILLKHLLRILSAQNNNKMNIASY